MASHSLKKLGGGGLVTSDGDTPHATFTSDGDTPHATFMIHDENMTCFTIDANKMLEMFSGIGSCGSSSLIHGVNDGTVMIKSGTINEFSFIINICNHGGLGQIQCVVLCMLPMCRDTG